MTDQTLSSSSRPAKGDDRNLVPVEPGAAATFEDQLFLFWKNNRNVVIALIALVIAGVVGWQIWLSMRAQAQADVGAAFTNATTVETRRAFARAHPGDPLAGIALLEVADDSYKNGRFEDAVRDYGAAAAVLQEPIFLGRARLGEGVSALQAGLTTRGEQALQKLAADSTVLMPYRTQAWYELASAAAGSGDVAKAREYIDKLLALEPNGYWASLASLLRSRLSVDETAGISATPTPQSTPAPMPPAASEQAPAPSTAPTP
jgi:hypothetical protein